MAFDFNRGSGGGSGMNNQPNFGGGAKGGGSGGGFSFGNNSGMGSGGKNNAPQNGSMGSGGMGNAGAGFNFGQNNKPKEEKDQNALVNTVQNDDKGRELVTFDDFPKIRNRRHGNPLDLSMIPWRLIFTLLLIGVGITLVVVYWDVIVSAIMRFLSLLIVVAIVLFCVRKIIFPNR